MLKCNLIYALRSADFFTKLTSVKHYTKISYTEIKPKLCQDCRNIPYLFTPQSRVLLEKLTGSQLVKEFPAFYGTRKFITEFTSAHHLSLF